VTVLRQSQDAAGKPWIGDWSSFEPALRRYIRRRIAPAQVDDAVQEVWLRLYSMRDPSTIQDRERYLFAIASSVLNRLFRHQNRYEKLDDDKYDLLRDEISPERELQSRQYFELILAKINCLPEKTRQIFILNRFEDMTYRQISTDLGISISAVEKHMMKALRALVGESIE
jgi:RNA polymerase sigma factor (sigma-70 family)